MKDRKPMRPALMFETWPLMCAKVESRLQEIANGALRRGPWARQDAVELNNLQVLQEYRHTWEATAAACIPNWRQQHEDTPYFTALADMAMVFDLEATLQALELEDSHEVECRLKGIITAEDSSGTMTGAWPVVRAQVKENLGLLNEQSEPEVPS